MNRCSRSEIGISELAHCFSLISTSTILSVIFFLSPSLGVFFSRSILVCHPAIVLCRSFFHLFCFLASPLPPSLRFIREIYPQSTLPVHRQSRNWTFDLAFGCQSGFLIWVVAIGRNPALLYSLRVSGRINRISLSQNYTA